MTLSVLIYNLQIYNLPEHGYKHSKAVEAD